MSSPLPHLVTDNVQLMVLAIWDHSSQLTYAACLVMAHSSNSDGTWIVTLNVYPQNAFWRLQCAINLKRFRQFAIGPDLKAFTS